VEPAAPEHSTEELAAKARMEEARAAAEAERLERERLQREFAANLEAAYEARAGALRTLLAGRLSRPEATRLLANFLVGLAYQDVAYNDSYLRHALSLDEHTADREAAPVLAFAAKSDDALLRAAVAVVADYVEALLDAGDEPDFTNPLVVLYYGFLTAVAAYKPSDFERAELAQHGEEPEPAEATEAEAPDGDAEATPEEAATAT